MSRNVIFVSHGDFTQASGIQLFWIARALTDLGFTCAICVPGEPATVLVEGAPNFQVLSFAEAMAHGVSFADDRPPDLVHAWTPREAVRKMTVFLSQRYNVPYFVHLEENENRLLTDSLAGRSLEDLCRLPPEALDLLVPLGRIHPHRAARMLQAARGITAVTDRLLEFKPELVPGTILYPGYRPGFTEIDGRNESLRASLGIAPEELLVTYPGNLHGSNYQEIRSLILALAIVNRRGIRAKLVKAGFNQYPLAELSDPNISQYVIDRGLVPHPEIPRLLAAADVLVQPGQPNDFSDYRFPAKLPEFFVSGRPVILPRSNIGLAVKDGEEAVVLKRGHCVEIADALQRLACDPELRKRIGQNGRTLALRQFNWETNVATLPPFYENCLAGNQPAAGHLNSGAKSGIPKIIAFHPKQSSTVEADSSESPNRGAAIPEPAKLTEVSDLKGLAPDNYLSVVTRTSGKLTLSARHFGISGFCFNCYLSDGGLVFEDGLDEFLRSRTDFPFCLCWGNPNRGSNSKSEELTQEQAGVPGASGQFMPDVIPIFKDQRYLRVEGNPVLLISSIPSLANPLATTKLLRAEGQRAGIPALHLVGVQNEQAFDPHHCGFDAALGWVSKDWPDDSRSDRDRDRANRVGPANRSGAGRRFYSGVEFPSAQLADASQQPLAVARGYEHQLRRTVADAMAWAELQTPFVFVSSGHEGSPNALLTATAAQEKWFLESTRRAIEKGITDFLRTQEIPVPRNAVSKLLTSHEDYAVTSRRARDEVHLTTKWFSDEQLHRIAKQNQRENPLAPLSYGTVRDYCDSFDNLGPLATLNGDLKDSQRPWMLKTILTTVRPGGRLLEIGAGEPFVADILDRLGYEVWVVDPYDGSGNGPVEYERYRAECPNVRFVRSLFGENVLSAPPRGFDSIYSISVLEHVPTDALGSVFSGMKKYLRPNGWSLHAIDHVRKGAGAREHYDNLKRMISFSGLKESDLAALMERMDNDFETYYLSAEGHNRWRGSLPYEEFPMRICVSIQLISNATELLN